MSRDPRAHGTRPGRRRYTVDDYVTGIRSGDRTILGRALTLVESSHEADQQQAQDLLTRILPDTGRSIRVGITGVPGVGKSSFIDVLGTTLTAREHRVAVLAVDPSSGISGGSILGDKTRMANLAVDDRAFIRPSPSAGTLGGIARKTRESLLLCEAAGYDVVLVETVGVGQSETVVSEMTDVFLGLLLTGAGDELQGIKRGLLEVVDILAVNKADGENRERAEQAAREVATALHIVHGRDEKEVAVLTCSAAEKRGIAEVWDAVESLVTERRGSGELERRRRDQQLGWMWALVDERLHAALRAHPDVHAGLDEIEAAVRGGDLPPLRAARRIVDTFLGRRESS